MSVEILIYTYLSVCVGMIAFNIVTVILSRRRKLRSFCTSIRLELKIADEIDRLAQTGAVSAAHLRYIERKLRRVNNMMTFDAAMERLRLRRSETLVRAYLAALDGVFITMAEDYCRRNEIEAAYFPYIIKKYRLLGGRDDRVLADMLLDLLRQPSLYCRENTMQAIYTAGDPELVVRALRVVNASCYYYNGKLLADGLLNFLGDKQALGEALWAAFEEFQPWMQATLLNYFRFSSSEYGARVLTILNDGTRDDELRFSCLRYFGRYPYAPARSHLLRYAAPAAGVRWEYAAIASSALASYPGGDTAALLERNLYHPSWYIRFNASKSLEQLGFGYRELIHVIEGHDRYASEILRYRFDVRELETGKETAACTTA